METDEVDEEMVALVEIYNNLRQQAGYSVITILTHSQVYSVCVYLHGGVFRCRLEIDREVSLFTLVGYVQQALLPFLRACALFYQQLSSVEEPTTLKGL